MVVASMASTTSDTHPPRERHKEPQLLTPQASHVAAVQRLHFFPLRPHQKDRIVEQRDIVHADAYQVPHEERVAAAVNQAQKANPAQQDNAKRVLEQDEGAVQEA